MGWVALAAGALLVAGCLLGENGMKRFQKPSNEVSAREGTQSPVWQNSLGMVFRPVPEHRAQMCIWEARIMDFAEFVADTGYDATGDAWTYVDDQWVQQGYAWSNTGYRVTSQHPVCAVSWQDAMAFCAWLTERERADGSITMGQRYRLPTEQEWASSAGIPLNHVRSELHPDVKKTLYLGNFHWLLGIDPFEFTAPVGSFMPNPNGFHDMAGNVWEYCLDDAGDGTRVIRGGAWLNRSDYYATAAARGRSRESIRSVLYGFRVVLGQVNTAVE